jgi:hypothetical protein
MGFNLSQRAWNRANQLMSMLMDCSFGHGEFAVDVFQALKQFQFSNRKKNDFLTFDERQ